MIIEHLGWSEFKLWIQSNKDLPVQYFDRGSYYAIYNLGSPFDLSSHSAVANLIHYYRMGDGDTFPTILDHAGLNNGTCINMEALDIKLDTP